MSTQFGTAICLHCKTEFIKRTHNHKYCTNECRAQLSLELKEARSTARYYIFERDGFKCVYCGSSAIEDGVTLHTDHIIPKSCGGKHSPYNLISACDDCNRHKAHSALDMSVYERILNVLINRNKGISNDMVMFIKRVFLEHFGIQYCSREAKGNNSVVHELMQRIKYLDRLNALKE